MAEGVSVPRPAESCDLHGTEHLAQRGEQWTCAACERTRVERVERAFVTASVAVWREIDRLSDEPGGYEGLAASTELRVQERAAWERYRAVLDNALGTEQLVPENDGKAA